MNFKALFVLLLIGCFAQAQSVTVMPLPVNPATPPSMLMLGQQLGGGKLGGGILGGKPASGGGGGGQMTPSKFFWADLAAGSSTNGGRPWPSPIPTGAIWRNQDIGLKWAQLEPARGPLPSPSTGAGFTLNQWLVNSAALGIGVMYDFYGVPSWANGTSNIGDEPTDVVTSAACQGVLAGTTTTDCKFKEFVTMLVQRACPSYTGGAPVADCKIRWWETPMNEFGGDGFWHNNGLGNAFTYNHLAIMANDAATIIRQYSSNAIVIAGPVACGGDGGHGSTNASGICDIALGQFMAAWHAIPGASLPDAKSFHAYGCRTNIVPCPFPEVNYAISMNGDVLNSAALAGCSVSTVVSPSCRYSMAEMPAKIQHLAAAPWADNLPIYQTEFSVTGAMLVGSSTANTNQLRQAWISRAILGLASACPVSDGLGGQKSCIVMNLDYQWDNQCWGTGDGSGAATCPGSPIIPVGITPYGTSWKTTVGWLTPATVDTTGVVCVSNTCHLGITKAGVHATAFWLRDQSSGGSVGYAAGATTTDVNAAVTSHSSAGSLTLSISPVLVSPL